MTDTVVEGVVVGEDEVALVPYTPAPMNLFGASSPAEVVAQATGYANALADVIRQRKLFTTIQGKEHVNVEGWCLLGSMLGVFPVLESAEPVDFDGVKGWRATVAAQTRDGGLVGRATALCLRSEGRWRNADDYAVLSMAQTRATSKCLRAPLGFIIKLAGFSPTPEAEIPPDGSTQAAAAAAPQPEPPAAERPSDEDLKKTHRALVVKHAAILGDLEKRFPRSEGGTWEQFAKAHILERYGVDSRNKLSIAQMDELIEWTKELMEAEALPF